MASVATAFERKTAVVVSVGSNVSRKAQKRAQKDWRAAGEGEGDEVKRSRCEEKTDHS